ncbi:Cytosol aminopeptidase family, N-terminal domain [Chitinophaga eiseniae]|uniref:Cytosol aminopeptidase family, N-terminal domain n=1 Tax=Chitinophaga eiseniae TaxID=634771 RepID=A0A1T4LVX8_9BACT|nr:M17 family peptidase N-terminal domain-containing protein [Chitinophaga eiseniae]SJZ58893.1 Cytosol aminopeptidase family, N-terminal domain [Chitinophaga eiseniae]
MNKIFTTRCQRAFVLCMSVSVFLLYSVALSGQQTDSPAKTTPIGTSKVWGKAEGISIIGLVQGPSAAVAPLQVACVFEYTEGDIFQAPALPAALNGMVHLDEALRGQITELRKSGKFEGHYLETLLITPPKGAIKAPKLLLIGLGDRHQFNADMMINVGAVALREATRLGVSGFAFASDIKDAGVDAPTALVAANVTKGIINAWRTQRYLQKQHLSPVKSMNQATLLAGPAFFEIAGEGIREAIASFNN